MKRIIVKKNNTSIVKTCQAEPDSECETCSGEVKRDRHYSKLLKFLADTYRKIYKKDMPIRNICSKCIKFNQEQLDIEHKKIVDLVNPALSIKDGTVITGIQKGNCYFSEVPHGSELFGCISERIAATLTLKIIRIEHSVNPTLLKSYLKRKYDIFGDTSDTPPMMKFSLDNRYGENYMFHGSQNKAYDAILDTGFDISYSRSTGLLGQGIYFARNASYSDGYACMINTDQGPIGIMLVCRVLLGTKIDVGQTGLTSLPAGVHSVSGAGDIYAVFNNFQAYPEFIIYYEKSNKIV